MKLLPLIAMLLSSSVFAASDLNEGAPSRAACVKLGSLFSLDLKVYGANLPLGLGIVRMRKGFSAVQSLPCLKVREDANTIAFRGVSNGVPVSVTLKLKERTATVNAAGSELDTQTFRCFW